MTQLIVVADALLHQATNKHTSNCMHNVLNQAHKNIYFQWYHT